MEHLHDSRSMTAVEGGWISNKSELLNQWWPRDNIILHFQKSSSVYFYTPYLTAQQLEIIICKKERQKEEKEKKKWFDGHVQVFELAYVIVNVKILKVNMHIINTVIPL